MGRHRDDCPGRRDKNLTCLPVCTAKHKRPRGLSPIAIATRNGRLFGKCAGAAHEQPDETDNALSALDSFMDQVKAMKDQIAMAAAKNLGLARKLARLKILALEILCECPEPSNNGAREISRDCKVHYTKELLPNG